MKPISKPEEIWYHGTECLNLLLYSLIGDTQQTSDDHLLVNINTTAALIQELHCFPSFRIRVLPLVDGRCQVGYQKQRESPLRASPQRERHLVVPEGIPGQFCVQACCTT